MHDHFFGGTVQLKKRAERRILQGLEIIKDGWLVVIPSIGHVLEEEFDFFTRNDVADVVGVTEPAEGQADHLVARDRRPAAVAGIDRGINLDSQAGDRKVV